MDTTFILCNCMELDINYNHTVTFNNKESQLNWFLSNQTYILTNNMYQRKSENVIRVDKTIEELEYTNYVVARNMNTNFTYFYFIVDKEYVNEYTTTLYLQLDLIQTYLFDIKFRECLIDRQHVNRWIHLEGGDKVPNTSYNYEEDNLDTGEYEIKNITTLYDYNNKGSYIIVSTEPLGVVDNDDDTTNDEGLGRGYMNGWLDEKGLWAMKSFEGYCSGPYQDTNGYWTIGYGITEANYPDYYNELVDNCTEVLASEFMGDIVYNFSSQVKDLCSENLSSDWLNQNKLNALTSYAYQYGVEGFKSTELWALIISGSTDEEIYNHYKSIEDYASRRQQEAEIFIGNYSDIYYITDYSTSTYVTDNDYKGHIPEEYL